MDNRHCPPLVDERRLNGRPRFAAPRRSSSDYDTFDLVDGDRIRRPVVELRRRGREPRGRGLPLDHRQDDPPLDGLFAGGGEIRRLFDWLVGGQVVPWNPTAAVRGPTHVVKRGKTPVPQPEEVRLLFDAIDTCTVGGLRDRALIGVMIYSFARVSAVVNMDVDDYYQEGKRWWLRLREKGGKYHALPTHHKAEAYLDAYLEAAGISAERGSPLWRSLTRTRELGERRMSRVDVFRMVKRRVKAAELGDAANCHTFRASGITAYLLNGGTLERAQAIAGHESPRTTQLYDRTADDITVEDIERIKV